MSVLGIAYPSPTGGALVSGITKHVHSMVSNTWFASPPKLDRFWRCTPFHGIILRSAPDILNAHDKRREV
eukprot:1171906-Rhodomonas_salina.4